MKVIGSGFGRTGTLSMKAALELLGFGPCYHMEEVIKNTSHMRMWVAISEGKPADWDALFHNYQATVDFPASVYYKELLAAYPNAKVVHTIRDVDRWFDSTYETIFQARTMIAGWMKLIFPPARLFDQVAENIVWNGLFDGKFEQRQRSIEIFEAHTDEVVSHVPPEQLLVFQVKDGWEPLCEFLGVPVPNVPFPHVNDRKSMVRRFTMIRRLNQLAPVAFAGAGLVLARRLLRSK